MKGGKGKRQTLQILFTFSILSEKMVTQHTYNLEYNFYLRRGEEDLFTVYDVKELSLNKYSKYAH